MSDAARDVTLCEVGLRDGLQLVPQFVDAEEVARGCLRRRT